jgi:threonyl-tRNA synthetase
MRTLLLHVNKFEVGVVEESNRPTGIVPETKNGTSEIMNQCLVVFFCVEKIDTEQQVEDLCQEIIKTSDEVGTKNLMIAPFVHLSKSIAEPEISKKFYKILMEKFANSDFVVKSSHFGYHKKLLLDIKGYPGSFRYREFY